MSAFWLTPMAWAGLALIVIPIVIHLLARRESRRIPFPSLRFIPASTLAALKRRTLTEWPLLVTRVLIIIAAVAAAASPVIVSEGRRASWNERYARAVVIAGNAATLEEAVRQEQEASFQSQRFAADRLADAIRDASFWLRSRPPARREVVIVGDVPEGAISARDFNVLDPHVGIRFLPASAPVAEGPHEMYGIAEMPGGDVARYRLAVTPTLQHTEGLYIADESAPVPQFEIRAAPDEQQVADALQRAVTREGLALSARTARPVTILFDGATEPAVSPSAATGSEAAWARRVLAHVPSVRGEIQNAGLVVRTSVRVTDPEAASLVAQVLRHVSTESLTHLEPRRETAATLATWSRAAGLSPSEARPADEGDRRWLWIAVIALLVLEQVIRRRTPDV